MKKRNIYQNQSQDLLSLFEAAGSSEKVMCVPLDYAKKDHLAMFCNGYGDILRKPFSVKNTPEGIAYIDDQVTRSCRRRGIKKEHVFFGGEDANSFAKNFVSTLRSKGFLVANVNAHDAKKQRGNLQASTDRIDLMGIKVAQYFDMGEVETLENIGDKLKFENYYSGQAKIKHLPYKYCIFVFQMDGNSQFAYLVEEKEENNKTNFMVSNASWLKQGENSLSLPNEHDLVFPNSMGNPIDQSMLLRKHFFPALKKAEIGRIRFHDLRHTYASLLIEQGENIKYIQNQLGHASPVVTLEVYAHLINPTNQEAACRLENTIFKTSGSKMVAETKKGVAK